MSTSKSIFISRELTPNSPLNALKFQRQVVDSSLLQFESIHFEALPDSDWIFFYSQKGVVHFFEQTQKRDITGRKIAAFGPKTAHALKDLEVPVHFIGTGYADQTAPAFLLLAIGESIIFPRARNSRKSMQKSLGKKINAIDLVVYDNIPKKDVEIPPCDILIFTSPLNAKTYFQHHRKLETQRVIAIGKTTARTIHELGIEKVSIPDQPNEEALLKLVEEIEPKS